MNTSSPWTVLCVDGRDAQDFLHRQLTADIAGLVPEQCIQAGLCQPDGRLLATPVVCWLEGRLRLILPADLAQTVSRRLQMFVLRDDVQLSVSDVPCRPIEANHSLAAGQTQETTDGLQLSLAGDVPRILQLGGETSNHIDVDTWRRQTIAAGAPQIYATTSGQLLPQSLRLDQLGGVSFRKGCYPGQEVVARLHYRGQLKRLLARADIEQGSCSPGETVQMEGRGIGLVVEAVDDAALVVVHQDALGGTGETIHGQLHIAERSLHG